MLHRLGPAAIALVSALVSALLAAPGLTAASAGAQALAPQPAFAAPAGAPAVADDPYTVAGVDVDVTAASAAEARDKAIIEGQRKAFTTLFKRLAADAGRVPPSVSDSDLQRMIQGFEIEKERGSAVRYVGSLSFKFRRKAVRTYLSSLGVAVVEPAARAASAPASSPLAAPGGQPAGGPPAGVKPTLVLPVSQSKGRTLLWEERTAWRSAWEDFAAAAGAAKVVIPPGELTDIADIGAAEAVAGDAASLAKIAAHYDAGDVLVAVLPSGDRLDPASGVQVTLTRYGAGGRAEGAADAVTVPVAAGEAAGAVLGRAVSAVVDRLASMPQSASPAVAPPPVNTEAQLQVAVPITGMQDWLEIRRRLTSNPMVLGVDTLALTRSRVDVTIRFRGEQDGLRAMLDRDSLTLAPAPNGWSLYLKSSAQSAPGGMPGPAASSPGPRPLGPGAANAQPPAAPLGGYYVPAPVPAYPAGPGYQPAPAYPAAPSEYDAEPAGVGEPPAYDPGRGAYPGGSRF